MTLQYHLPFTSSLFNAGFLARIALTARLGVAVIRTVLNAPMFNPDQEATKSEKLSSLIERATIELLGTAIYASGMYLSMDAVSGLFEKFSLKPQFEAIEKQIKALEKVSGDSRMGTIFKRVFSGQKRGTVSSLVHKYILGGDFGNWYGQTKAGYYEFFEDLKSKNIPLPSPVNKSVKTFSRRLNKVAMLTQLAGIVAACVLGGPILQNFNDKVARPFAFALSGGSKNKTSAPEVQATASFNKMVKMPLVNTFRPAVQAPVSAPLPKQRPAHVHSVPRYKPGFVPFDPVTLPVYQWPMWQSPPPRFQLPPADVRQVPSAFNRVVSPTYGSVYGGPVTW